MTSSGNNRLSTSTSPYLQQHAHHPVDWFPWGDEALARARAEDKPIFLSIGYSACHWCHVMAHESFENPEVAAALNRDFVSIKVDREERPDLDDLYMGAVQAMAGRGGWPMSVWLTPDLKPFYGGTYFPREARFGFPGFLQILAHIDDAWREKRQAILENARLLTERLELQARIEPGTGRPSDRCIEEALGSLRRSFDPAWGGFGGAPKFPPFLALELLMRRGTASDQKMVVRTLDAMADGGMFDHLGGGFARYSVDGQWLVPHFEKMLYDNALLVPTYLMAYLATGREKYATVARRTLDYLLRDLRDAGGGFHSSEDADSEGEEGAFYTFTPGEVNRILGPQDGALFCDAFGVCEAGHLEPGKSVLHRFDAPENLASDHHLSPRGLEEKLEALCRRMWQARERRVRPHRDDKVLASWNGLTLAALARGYQVFGDVRYLEAALQCAGFLQRELVHGDGLLRVWRQGSAHTPGFLEDYASIAIGLVELYESTFDAAWLDWAGRLTDQLRIRFEDSAGGFFSTESGQADLLFRQKPGFDHSLPSANALAVQALSRVGSHLDRPDLIASAERALSCFESIMDRAPRACLGLVQGLEFAALGPVQIMLAGEMEDPRWTAMLETAWRRPVPRRVLALAKSGSPFVAQAGQPTAYVCRDHTCSKPATSAEDLAKLLDARQF